MKPSSISENVESALRDADRNATGMLGQTFHTFRIRLPSASSQANLTVAELVSVGWHLIGGPVVVPASGDEPPYAIISMVRVEGRPGQIRGEFHFSGGGGEIRGEIR